MTWIIDQKKKKIEREKEKTTTTTTTVISCKFALDGQQTSTLFSAPKKGRENFAQRHMPTFPSVFQGFCHPSVASAILFWWLQTLLMPSALLLWPQWSCQPPRAELAPSSCCLTGPSSLCEKLGIFPQTRMFLDRLLTNSPTQAACKGLEVKCEPK